MFTVRPRTLVAILAAVTLSSLTTGCSGLLGRQPESLPSSSVAAPSETTGGAEPTDDSFTLPVPTLDVTDLGESNCTRFEVCTFVDVMANEVCRGAVIDIDLYDENDEYLDTESVPIGDLKKDQKASNIEVGTDDYDADYVEQSDYSCG